MTKSKEPKRLSVEACRAKADECRDLAQHAAIEAHRVMLRHMAETWDRIAGNLTDGK